MSSAIPPGRPGNLTPEQEEKLREFWGVVARVAGLADTSASTSSLPANGTETASPSTAPADAGKDKKSRTKGRLSLFKRKHDKDSSSGDTDSTNSATSNSTPVDISNLSLEDDKHGANKAFKAALADQTPEELRNAIWSMCKHDNPDGLLLRFLRARKWDVNAALIMLVSTMQWRSKEMHLDDDIMATGELGAAEQEKSADAEEKKLGEDFLAQMRMGKSFLHGVDKEGRPLCYVNVRLHRQGEQGEKSLERFTVYTIETARMMLRPPVDTATVVFDMTGFSMANMDYSPVKFMIKCFEANYPESLGAVLVHKAPWVFQGIWSIIRGWLDPVVASKVHFTKTLDDLSSFIPLNHIPEALGGNEKWTYTYIEPSATENAAMKDTAARDKVMAEREDIIHAYEDATIRWVQEGGSDEVKMERVALAEKLRENYWRLDPFVRARSLYDRTGVLGKEGVLRWYPDEEKKAETGADDVD
ncbi:CRAL/TRIO domain-containing protein [Saccharata proteae CBS 121410]|uniref:CRAL/TRIO domain-containing protein n=1 Tax=Saccharata proteae CBS 121410 TaxID=1314787 RepID=A0A9P4LSI3_9PEZI|nr:CRAL/TRIO domain-containing protein [Saccharata proteae CBS 121410]